MVDPFEATAAKFFFSIPEMANQTSVERGSFKDDAAKRVLVVQSY